MTTAAPTSAARRKPLGRAGWTVSAIGQGCGALGGGYQATRTDRDVEEVAALQLGIDLGMTLLDTAEIYGNGHSEELVGQAIRGRRDRVCVATKMSTERMRADDVIRAAEGSLQRLRTDSIDLYQIHWPNPTVPIEETMGAMARLVRDGKVRAIGLSNFSVRAMRAAQAALGEQRLASLQMEYNLWDRMAEEHFLPHCEQEELTLIAYSPLDQGRISAGSERLRALEAIAAKHEKTAAQIALAWLIRHPRVVAIPKASNPKHVRENAEAAEIALSDEEAEAISRAFSGKPSLVPTDRIRVVTDASHPAYRTVDEARRNALGFTPSPQELADDVLVGDPLKPVRLVRTTDVSGAFDYDLIEGRIRYWGWVIAHNGARPIPSLIRE